MATSAGVTGATIPQAPSGPTGARGGDDQVRSRALGRSMAYRVLLPRDYQSSPGKRYPVLYLLHGLAGDETSWTNRTRLAEYSAALPLIVVMPAAANGWYTNAADGSDRFEDYIVSDLLADVAKKYRTLESREARAIAGASMGGYGALKIALKRPGMFSIAASFSGAVGAARDGSLDRLIGKAESDRLRLIFGPADAAARRDNDVFALAATTPRANAPRLFIRCGSSDPLIESNRELAAVFRKAAIAVDFQETPGAHNWDYWDRSVREFLPALMKMHARLPHPLP